MRANEISLKEMQHGGTGVEREHARREKKRKVSSILHISGALQIHIQLTSRGFSINAMVLE